MPKVGYIGSSNLSKKIKKGYIGVNNSAKKIKKVYLGVNGKSKLVWNSENVIFVSVKQFYDKSGKGYYSIENDGDTLKFTLYGGYQSLDSLALNDIDMTNVPTDKRILYYDTNYVKEYNIVGTAPNAEIYYAVKSSTSSYLKSGNADIDGYSSSPKYENSWDFTTSFSDSKYLDLTFWGDTGTASVESSMYVSVSITNLRFADGTKIKFVEE